MSYIGYKTMTVKAANGMKITMQEDGKALNEVVVTALGIKRDRKALGYGLEEVKGEELTKAKETNVINSLSGKGGWSRCAEHRWRCFWFYPRASSW